jgi:hypothetical protein
MSARANIVPKWSGVLKADDDPCPTCRRSRRLSLDSLDLFNGYIRRLAGKGGMAIELVIRKLARPKSASQLGYLFGIVYPVIGETYCDTDYDPDALHDALMRKLRGLKPEPNPLQMRETLRDKDHEYVSDYISDLRLWALDQGIVTPDATKVEARPVRVSKAA